MSIAQLEPSFSGILTGRDLHHHVGVDQKVLDMGVIRWKTTEIMINPTNIYEKSPMLNSAGLLNGILVGEPSKRLQLSTTKWGK